MLTGKHQRRESYNGYFMDPKCHSPGSRLLSVRQDSPDRRASLHVVVLVATGATR
jgi:hypothetical protein